MLHNIYHIFCCFLFSQPPPQKKMFGSLPERVVGQVHVVLTNSLLRLETFASCGEKTGTHSSESRGEEKNAESDVNGDDNNNNNLSCLGNRNRCTSGLQSNRGGGGCV